MANWYTADPHFGHENIIRYCDRPFHSVSEMDAVIQSNYARRVGPDDDLWIVGDFGFGRASAADGYLEGIFERIPGRKHLVVGNHDNDRVRRLPWSSIHDIVGINDSGQKLVLCHYPMITWEGARKGAIQLFGHVHQNWMGSRNSINVGVDVWRLMPIRIGDIVKRARTLPEMPLFGQAEPRVGRAPAT